MVRLCLAVLGCLWWLMTPFVFGAEVDEDGDGRPEQWHTFKDGQLADIALDTNRDGRPDQWHRYHPSGELYLVEVDSSGTGKVDRVVHYEAPGRIAQVWENLDAAGQPRTRVIFEAGTLVRGEFDTTGNGRVNQWLFYNAEGQIVRAEYDQHATGGPSQWEHFSPGNQEPFKVERDTDGDGKADTVWEKATSATERQR